jgi:hypothetical protein
MNKLVMATERGGFGVMATTMSSVNPDSVALTRTENHR